MGKFRGTMIGCGNYGRQLMDVIIKREDVEMVAVTGRTPEKLEKVCKDYYVKGFFNFREMYDEMKPDFVFIASPNCLHKEHTVEAAKRGIHVFSEKPIAMTLEGADAMVEAVEKNGVVFVGNGGGKFSPIYRKVHEMIQQGELGDIMGQWARVMRGYGFARHQAVLHPELSGGWLIHHAIHLILRMLWYAGPAKEVYCRNSSTVPSGTEEVVYGLITFQNGSHGIFSDSVGQMRGHGGDVIGSKGTIEFVRSKGSSRQTAKFHREGNVGYDKYEEIAVEVPEDTRYSGPIGHFFDCINDRNLACWSGVRDGRDSVEVAVAMQESARTGKVVKIG